MAGWSDGYVTEVQYTSKFYPEMAPGFLAFACLRQGVRPPDLEAGASYLELGCGQGYGLNLLAAANPALSFHGVDFHPGQIANAQRLAREAGLSNVAFEDVSFRQMLDRGADRLPKFDIIALHGVMSWVTAENRAAIIQILDTCLKPGGLAYVSYNCLPGWATATPLRQFVADHARQSAGTPEARVAAALQAALQMAQAPGGYFGSTPTIKARIEEALTQDPAYLVHEYLHESVHALYHADVARELDGARLAFAASANIADDLVSLAAPAPLHPQIQAAQNPTWRETLLDYASPKTFRRDVFVRGRNGLGRLEREAMLDAVRFSLLAPADAATFEFPIPIGQIKGQPAVYEPIVAALADGPRSYAELRALPALAGAREGALLQAVTMLVGGRQIHPLSEAPPDGAEAARRFNRAVIARAAHGEAHNHLAAPAVGGGVGVDFADQMALRALFDGLQDQPEAAARLGWETMARTGRRLIRGGAILQDAAANEAELAQRIAAFNQAKLPLLRRLGVV